MSMPRACAAAAISSPSGWMTTQAPRVEQILNSRTYADPAHRRREYTAGGWSRFDEAADRLAPGRHPAGRAADPPRLIAGGADPASLTGFPPARDRRQDRRPREGGTHETDELPPAGRPGALRVWRSTDGVADCGESLREALAAGPIQPGGTKPDHPLERGHLPPAHPRPRQDHLRRPQLPHPYQGRRARAADQAHASSRAGPTPRSAICSR